MTTSVHAASGAAGYSPILPMGNNISASQFAAAAPQISGMSQLNSDAFAKLMKEALPKLGLTKAGEQVDGLGELLGNLGAGAEIAGGLARIFLGFQANKLAKQSLNFQREAYRNNLNDTRTAFNKALTDQATTRDFVQGTNNAAEYIKKFQLGNGN